MMGRDEARASIRTAVPDAWLSGTGYAARLDPEPALKSVGFALVRAAHLAREAVERSLEPLGIRGHHLWLMVLLDMEGPMSQTALTRRLWIDRTTMVHLIDELESRGLVERTRDPKDRRAHVIRLSSAGKAIRDHAHERVQAGEAAFLATLSPTEQEQLHSYLIRLGTQS